MTIELLTETGDKRHETGSCFQFHVSCTMPRHFKIHELLDAADLAALEEFAREPARTVDQVHEWMLAKGLTLARSSAGTWLRNFLIRDQFKDASDAAKNLVESLKDKGVVDLADATTTLICQKNFEFLIRARQDGEISAKELREIAAGNKNVVQTKGLIETVKEEMQIRFDQQMATVQKKATGITAEDIAEARKAIFG